MEERLLFKPFGWKKDPRDMRDYLHRPTTAVIPDVFLMHILLPSVRDQGNLGSCTGFGIGGNLTCTAKMYGQYSEWFSPTWIYNGGRKIAGDLLVDSGCYPRDNFEFIRQYGCLLEHFKPYRDTLDKTDPITWGLNEEAAKWPIIEYFRVVDGIDYICNALFEGNFISLGSPWYESWCEVGSDGVLPEDYSFIAGGHATFLYGYDKKKKVFHGQNSWGSSWGNGGLFEMPFSAIEQFKKDGGYDAHYPVVRWVDIPPPPPVVKKSKWWIWALAGIAVVVAAILLF